MPEEHEEKYFVLGGRGDGGVEYFGADDYVTARPTTAFRFTTFEQANGELAHVAGLWPDRAWKVYGVGVKYLITPQ